MEPLGIGSSAEGGCGFLDRSIEGNGGEGGLDAVAAGVAGLNNRRNLAGNGTVA